MFLTDTFQLKHPVPLHSFYENFFISFFSSGMALIQMCIELMKEQLVEKVSSLMSEIGMGGTNLNTEMMKVTKPDRLKQTPADMTGNELDFNEKRRKKDKKDGEEDEEVPTDENV